MLLRSTISLAALATFTLSACAVGAEDGSAGTGGGGGKADDASIDDTTRAKIVAALHATYLDATVHGQPNEIVVRLVRVAGDQAWITGDVQKRGGGEINWADSETAEELVNGIFDGPHIEALLRRDEDGNWSSTTATIGSTDVWWQGLWFRYAVNCELFPDSGCVETTEPAAGSQARRDITRAIHEQGLDASLHGQPNELVYSRIRSGGSYAFALAEVQKPGGGELDWSNTDYATEANEGWFDAGHVDVILQKVGSSWKVHTLWVGSTDVPWSGLWNQFASIPCALFPVTVCDPEPEEN